MTPVPTTPKRHEKTMMDIPTAPIAELRPWRMLNLPREL